VLYEALTRRKPFGGDSLTTISYKIVHDTFLSLRDVDPEIPEEFETIVAKALEKEPARRYQRGKELAVDLRNAVRPPGTPPIELEDTLIAENGRIPTIEVPFPDSSAGEGRRGSSTSRRRAAAAVAAPPPLLRRRIPSALFLGLPLALLLIFGATSWALWQKRVDVPRVDTRREARVERQRQLRSQAQEALARGDVDTAYEKYLELQKLAPNSPAVKETLQNIEKIRIANLSMRQRIEQARAKLQEGKDLYDKKQYSKAISSFEQAFHLNPNDEEAVNYLKMSREMMQLQQLQSPQVAGGIFPTTTGPQIPAGRAATLNVVVRSTTSDGYVYIKAGNNVLVHQNLWKDTASGATRRRQPQDVQLTRPVPAGTVDVVVAYVVPSQNINLQKIMRQSFEVGKSYTLVVRVDRSRQLDVRVARV
jgi:tetratricopeptide (TPR) repeat protein